MTVEKIIVLGDNIIGRANSFVIFDVTYEATILKPVKGNTMSGNVCMVFQHGIFVDISGKMKVLIPAASMIGYSYCSDDNTFQNNDDVIVQDVEIDIEIVLTKYERKQFSCIGKLCSVDVIESESD
jgi:DNA-directed RNA polymerase subunit E'/Rpb7